MRSNALAKYRDQRRETDRGTCHTDPGKTEAVSEDGKPE
jgi:hypothetical protein